MNEIMIMGMGVFTILGGTCWSLASTHKKYVAECNQRREACERAILAMEDAWYDMDAQDAELVYIALAAMQADEDDISSR